ncbi:PEP/pyruvate-binding domain-containing protein [Nonomuraea typhae]|uniref:PEP/pyruvate-binding domain-containing protein n=1 Tax=Nonomuraea typhae TaxID=2603600 RepID=A0ABW7YQQ3_9ACTN
MTASPPMVLPLGDAGADLPTAGGKGASLARLSRAGLPVPAGFHITTAAYREFVAPFRDRLGGLDSQELFAAHEIPAALAAEIRAAFDALGADTPVAVDTAVAGGKTSAVGKAVAGGKAVAVRSSATAEDLPEMSFAGQQDTYLDVRADGLLDAVRRCWASLWNPRAVAYREHNGVPHDDVALAVVVQELVDADAAGILFTADPVTGARGETVVNAAWGLGEAVVGGLVTPDSAVVAGGGVRSYTVADKAVMTVRAAGGTREEEVPAGRRHARVLADDEVVRLAVLGQAIQKLYGVPMDVEWARRGADLFVLQARPITGLPGETEEWNDSGVGEYLWTSGNLGEAIPDVMTPVTWSLVRLFIREAMSAANVPGFQLVGNIGGRFYLNLSMAVSAAKAFGMSSRLGAIEQVFGKIPPGLDVPLLPAGRWQLIKAMAPAAIRVRRRVNANVELLPGFLATARRRCEALRSRAGQIEEPAALAAFWDAELLPYVVLTCQMLEAAGRQGGAALVMTRDRLRTMVGESDAEAMLTGANTGGELASMGPVIGLGKLARGEIGRDEYAALYGHRGAHEFEVSIPRPGEDPGWIDKQLAETATADARDLLARQEEARAAAWARFDRRHPGKGAAMRERVARWKAIVRDREDARSENMRAFWAMRAFVLRAGELTGLGSDVFYLSVEEILTLLRGGVAPVDRIPVRQATYRKYASLPIYPMLIVGRFDPVRWAASPDRRADLYDARGGQAPVGEAVTGFPGAPGVVEGVARVLSGPEEGERLAAGEILVTTLTNIGWTPMFPRAAAVVTDMGAPLSHASIVARELGIPAVVGTGNATMRIHDGDRIRVDGERGTVEVLN